ncbi:MAG TPA: thioredoxin-disulfide reductase [Clostridiales bacterium]|nr:thioredoxin-disulfide reductase [Clostridiales bacterium]
MNAEVRNVVVVGGGPAGLTAAIYAGRFGMSPLVLEPGLPGGKLTLIDRIENFPGFPGGIGGPELAQRLDEQAREYGAEFRAVAAEAIRRDGALIQVATGDGEVTARSVIVASGATPLRLGVPGEREFLGRGVSYCATCDGPFFRDKDIAVVGGGDSAVEEALCLTRFARSVTVIHRRERLRASEVLQQRALAHPLIRFRWSAEVIAVEGSDQVEGIRLRDRQGESLLPAEGVFIYVGIVPVTGFLGGQVELDARGHLRAAEDTATSLPGFFAAGDVRGKPLRQVATAVADGAVAAMAAEKYLTGDGV